MFHVEHSGVAGGAVGSYHSRKSVMHDSDTTPTPRDLFGSPPKAEPPLVRNEIDDPVDPALAEQWTDDGQNVPPPIVLRMKATKNWKRFLRIRDQVRTNRECNSVDAAQIAYEIVDRKRSRHEAYWTRAEIEEREVRERERRRLEIDRDSAKAARRGAKSETEYRDEVSDTLASTRLANELLLSSLFEGKSASPQTVVKFAFEHLYIRDVNPTDAPSAGAWGLLLWARSKAENQEVLYQMWAKLLPTRADLDRASKRVDDGRSVLSTITQIQRSLRDAISDQVLDPDAEVVA